MKSSLRFVKHILFISGVLACLQCNAPSPQAESNPDNLKSESQKTENNPDPLKSSSPQTENNYDKLKIVQDLPPVLKECSGLVYLGNKTFAGVNDGGSKPVLYVFKENEIEPRVVKITGVKNNDWEELTSDNKFIYIGDTGNNGGTRRNLQIYKVRKTDALEKNEVIPEIIAFSYEGQTRFNDSNIHNFDCEAMICVGDSLYLFSKNRGNLKTDLYRLPNVPGDYIAKHLSQFDAEGLVTGAAIRNSIDGIQLVLIGYSADNTYKPFIIKFDNVDGTHFFDGPASRTLIAEKLQAETVLYYDDATILISNEHTKGVKGKIFKVIL